MLERAARDGGVGATTRAFSAARGERTSARASAQITPRRSPSWLVRATSSDEAIFECHAGISTPWTRRGRRVRGKFAPRLITRFGVDPRVGEGFSPNPSSPAASNPTARSASYGTRRDPTVPDGTRWHPIPIPRQNRLRHRYTNTTTKSRKTIAQIAITTDTTEFVLVGDELDRLSSTAAPFPPMGRPFAPSLPFFLLPLFFLRLRADLVSSSSVSAEAPAGMTPDRVSAMRSSSAPNRESSASMRSRLTRRFSSFSTSLARCAAVFAARTASCSALIAAASAAASATLSASASPRRRRRRRSSASSAAFFSAAFAVARARAAAAASSFSAAFAAASAFFFAASASAFSAARRRSASASASAAARRLASSRAAASRAAASAASFSARARAPPPLAPRAPRPPPLCAVSAPLSLHDFSPPSPLLPWQL